MNEWIATGNPIKSLDQSENEKNQDKINDNRISIFTRVRHLHTLLTACTLIASPKRWK